MSDKDAKVIGHQTDDSGETVGVYGEVDSSEGCGFATPDDVRIDGALIGGSLTNGDSLKTLAGDNLTISDGALQVDTTTDDGPQTTVSVNIEDSEGNTIVEQSEILSYSHDIIAPIDERTGERTGQPRPVPVEFVRVIDGSTPRLAQAHADNESLTTTFEWYDDTDTHYFTIVLSGATVTGFGTSNPGLEDIRLTYNSIKWRSETSGSETTMAWDSSS